MFGADEPVVKNIEESRGANFGRSVEIFGEGAHGAFVDFEEQAVLAAEMLEDRTFGDAKCRGDIADAGGVITILREMLHGGFDDAGALGLRTGAGREVARVTRRGDGIAGDSAH